MAFKIYTKTGDSGETALFGGKRLPKDHLRIEAYGTVDELNAHIGVIKDFSSEETTTALLLAIQHQLFTIGSHLACDPEKQMKLPEISMQSIVDLEVEIDRLTSELPELKHFVLPGGHLSNSFCHVARCVCRRAERAVVALSHSEPVEPILIQYLNRLSDYLFTLCRAFSQWNDVEEVKWMPNNP